MKKYFVINGKPESGKDTFIDFIKEYINENKNSSIKVYNISSIDVAKDILKNLGWDGIKTPKIRDALADLKEWMDKYFNYTTVWLEKNIINISEISDDAILFIHIREPEKITLLKDLMKTKHDINIETIYIYRKGSIDTRINNNSDKVENITGFYDHYIYNPVNDYINKELPFKLFRTKAYEFAEELFCEHKEKPSDPDIILDIINPEVKDSDEKEETN